ncbi:MAG: hypothetical protein RMI94_01000 [Bryobacterales bacterium]|nr:hypothetical protein [Bryobacteraceae bacterium]MDW8129099.1 hypothetical protein [Bryobacterales bacterium]
MDPMLTLAAVVLALGALLYTLNAPGSGESVRTEPDWPARQLEQRKAAIYESLRELVFEFRTGKLSEEDYRATRQELRRELAAVTAELERLATGKPSAPAGAATGAAQAKAPAGAVCASCGARFPRPMKFCGECGKPMGAVAS